MLLSTPDRSTVAVAYPGASRQDLQPEGLYGASLSCGPLAPHLPFLLTSWVDSGSPPRQVKAVCLLLP